MVCSCSQMLPSALKVRYGITFGFVFGRVNKTEASYLKHIPLLWLGKISPSDTGTHCLHCSSSCQGLWALSASIGSSLTFLIFLFLKCLKCCCFLLQILVPAASHISRRWWQKNSSVDQGMVCDKNMLDFAGAWFVYQLHCRPGIELKGWGRGMYLLSKKE